MQNITFGKKCGEAGNRVRESPWPWSPLFCRSARGSLLRAVGTGSVLVHGAVRCPLLPSRGGQNTAMPAEPHPWCPQTALKTTLNIT